MFLESKSCIDLKLNNASSFNNNIETMDPVAALTFNVPAGDVAAPALSIVVPALNEEAVVGTFMDWCREGLAKAGVMLLALQAKTAGQQELDLGDGARETEVRNGRLMAALDALNNRYGKGTLKLGSALVEGRDAGQRSRWVMKQERRTPRYTTRFDELLTVG